MRFVLQCTDPWTSWFWKVVHPYSLLCLSGCTNFLVNKWLTLRISKCATIGRVFIIFSFNYSKRESHSLCTPHTLLHLPLALQPIVGFGLSNNVPPFCPICHQLSPSSHSQHLKISFYFFSPSFPGSSSSSRPFQFLSEDLFGHPILLHSLQVTQPTYPLPLYPFYYIFLVYSSLLVLDLSYFSIPYFRIPLITPPPHFVCF